MRDLISSIDAWLEQELAVACAMVIKTWGSSPRPAGSLMAISEKGHISGSVSGGCVESAVLASALDVLACGDMRIEEYHATTERAHDVGLSCGGSLDVCVCPFDKEVYRIIRTCVLEDKEYVHGVLIDAQGDSRQGTEICITQGNHYGLLTEEQFGEVELLIELLPKGVCAQVVKTSFGNLFVKRVLPRPQIISIGATHVAIALMKMAQIMGYRTVVVDPRAVFATKERFSFVDELYHGWPEEVFKTKHITSATAVCALTHDPKIDEPALALAVRSDAFYIGSLGRAATQLKRCDGLLERGLTREDISRIYGPIGLDIGGKEPAEIALSILSEIHAVKHHKVIDTRTLLASADAERVKEMMQSIS